MYISFEADMKAAERLVTRAQRGAVKKAMNSTLNKAIATCKTKAGREIASDLNLKPSFVKRYLTVRRSNPNTMFAFIKSVGKPIPLIQFKGTKQNAGGVQHAAWNKPMTGLHWFIATMPSGHTGVFSRKGEKIAGQKQKIEQKFGGSVPKSMAEEKVMRQLETTARESFRKNFAHQLKFYLGKLG